MAANNRCHSKELSKSCKNTIGAGWPKAKLFIDFISILLVFGSWSDNSGIKLPAQ